MSADRRSSLVGILSRSRREAVPRQSNELDDFEELQGEIMAGRAGEERSSRRTYSGVLSVGQQWKKKASRSTTREQTGQSVMLMTLEPAGARLMPIHEVGSLVVCTNSEQPTPSPVPAP